MDPQKKSFIDDEEKLMNSFVKAFQEVVVPILEGQDKKLEEHDRKFESIQETLDSHTASLIQLEKSHDLIREIYNEVKGNRSKLSDHEERITNLEAVA